jgi:hypothetical protein
MSKGFRLVLELPLFMLYTAVLAAGGKGLHEALLSLNANQSLSASLRAFSYLASQYARLHASSLEVITSLRRLADRVRDARVRSFIRGYIAVRLSRGSVLEYVERSLQRLVAVVDTSLRQRLELVGGIMESIVLLASVVVFTLAVVAGSVAAMYGLVLAVVLTCTVAAVLLRLQVFEVYALPGSRINILLSILLLASIPPVLLLDNGLDVVFLAATLALDVHLLYRNLFSLRRLSSSINAFRSVFEAIQLGLETSNAIISSSRSIPEEARFVLRTGRAPERPMPGLIAVLTHILAESLRAGSRAARPVSMVIEFLEAVSEKFSLVIKYALLYEFLTAAVYIVLVLSYMMAISAISSSPITIPLQLVDATLVAKTLGLTAATACISVGILVWGNAASFALPVILIAYKLAVSAMNGLPLLGF